MKHRAGTIIGLVIVFILAGFLIWNFNGKTKTPPRLTTDQIQQVIKATTATGTETISKPEKKKLIQASSASASSSETITPTQKEQLINAMSAK